MKSRSFRAAIGALATGAALIAAAPATSEAACYSSTAADQTFADSASDGADGLAPEIVGVVAVVDDKCDFGAAAVIADMPDDLISDSSVGIYMNTDGNTATGSSLFDGADRVVIFVGQLGTDLPPGLGTWTGSDFSFDGSPDLGSAGAAGFVATFDQLGIAAPTSIGIRAGALWSGIYDTYSDWAPDVLAPSFTMPVSFSTTPPPVPPSTPAGPATPTTPASAEETADSEDAYSCVVPRLKGLSVAKARRRLDNAGCDYVFKKVKSRKRPGRVVKSAPKAGRSASGIVRVSVVRGVVSAKASAAAVNVYESAERAIRLAG